ncbi:hypothetical protein ABXJ76_07830 [Methylobacter sp. G7]|uniref:phage tail terminator protein n=1 Tax=Methylobacter sp. G7 TaxID=3230117 RepID=UPI003D808F2B
MIELLDLAPWVVQLQAQCPSFDGRVFKTLPDDELTIDLYDSPVAFVYLESDESDDNRNKNGSVRQITVNTVAVEIIIRRASTDRLHESAVDFIRSYRKEVFNALIAWQPPGCIKPVQHVAGKLQKKEAKQLKWIDTFSTENLITSL